MCITVFYLTAKSYYILFFILRRWSALVQPGSSSDCLSRLITVCGSSHWQPLAPETQVLK